MEEKMVLLSFEEYEQLIANADAIKQFENSDDSVLYKSVNYTTTLYVKKKDQVIIDLVNKLHKKDEYCGTLENKLNKRGFMLFG